MKIFLAFFLVLSVSIGYCETKTNFEVAPAWTQKEITVNDWQKYEHFVTVGKVNKIGELGIGRVAVYQPRTKNYYSVLVIPYREISANTKVEVVEIFNQLADYESTVPLTSNLTQIWIVK